MLREVPYVASSGGVLAQRRGNWRLTDLGNPLGLDSLLEIGRFWRFRLRSAGVLGGCRGRAACFPRAMRRHQPVAHTAPLGVSFAECSSCLTPENPEPKDVELEDLFFGEVGQRELESCFGACWTRPLCPKPQTMQWEQAFLHKPERVK